MQCKRKEKLVIGIARNGQRKQIKKNFHPNQLKKSNMEREEIESQIQKEMDEFLSSKYPNQLPVWFHANFDKAIMEFPQSQVPYRSDLIKGILSKKDTDQLNIYEVGFVSTVMLTVPPKCIAKDIRIFLENRATYESIFAKYEMMKNNKQRALQLKAATMAQNNRKRILPANSMQIK